MGMKRPNSFPSGERKLQYLLYDLCTDWGYCLSPAESERIAGFSEITAEMFAIEVLKAEGLELDPELIKKISSFFVEKIGAKQFSSTAEN